MQLHDDDELSGYTCMQFEQASPKSVDQKDQPTSAAGTEQWARSKGK